MFASNDQLAALERTFLVFAQAFLAKAASIRPPGMSEPEVIFEDNRWSRTFVVRPGWRFVCTDLFRAHFQFDATLRHCAKAHSRLGVFYNSNLPYPEQGNAYTNEAWLLVDVIIRLVEEKNSWAVEEQELMARYRRQIALWSGLNTMEASFTIPLLNVEGTSAVRIDSGELAPFSSHEKNALVKGFTFDLPVPLSELSRSRYRLEIRTTGTPQEVTDFANEAALAAEYLVIAMRLVGNGDVGAIAVFSATGWRSLNDIRGRELGRPYVLNSEKTIEIAECYQMLSNISFVADKGLGGDLEFPLRRFNQSYLRSDPDDKIVDFAISLESALLRGVKQKRNKNLDLQKRAGLLLSPTDPTRQANLIDNLYKTRNRIVHDGSSVNSFKIWPDCETRVRSILRTYLKRLENEESLEAINRTLGD